MLNNRDEILAAARNLPENDQLYIARELFGSPPPGPLDELSDDEFEAELDRRSGDFEGSVDWEVFRHELRDRLRRT